MICQSVLLLIYKWVHYSCIRLSYLSKLTKLVCGIIRNLTQILQTVLTNGTILTYALIKVKGSLYKQACSSLGHHKTHSVAFPPHRNIYMPFKSGLTIKNGHSM